MTGGNGREWQLLLVGIGGQGVLTAAEILAGAAHAGGVPVIVGQLHGMSQRGGSVEATVVFGSAESSFLCGREPDAVVAFEPQEALRAAPLMGPRTVVVLSRAPVASMGAVLAHAPPTDAEAVVERLREVAREVHAVDTQTLVGSVGETRTLNVLMLGAAAGAGLLPVSERALLEAIEERCGAKYANKNRRAFLIGRDATRLRQPSGASAP